MGSLRLVDFRRVPVVGTSALALESESLLAPPGPRRHLVLVPDHGSGAARPRVLGLRLTRRGVAVGWVLCASTLLGLVVALSTLLQAPSVPARTTPAGLAAPASARTVAVQSGDTLWSVAVRVSPTADPRRQVEELKRLNGLSTPALQAGQVLRVPGR